MESILQKNKTKCFLCGQNSCGDHLDKHHVFNGYGLRDKSEEDGLTVYLHHNKCHEFGKNSAHKNAEVARRLKLYAQKKAMEYYGWSLEEFRERYHKSYIGEQAYEN